MSEMGTDRTANVTLTADVEPYRQALQQATVETNTLTARIDDLTRGLDQLSKAAGKKLTIFGGLTTAGMMGAEATFAVWEKQMSSLSATAAVTGKSFDAMKDSVNSMRREFPVATSEATALVSIISRMGDGTAPVQKLTNTFAKLGGATGESTTALAQGMLQLQRTMGTAQSHTERYANALTALSQKNGVSAQGILDFSAAIAPIAKVAGMSQEAVMGVSTAFNKAGQDGYLAANAFNKMLTDIMQSVTTGSGDLAKYSNLIGVTVEQFQKMDKTKAITQIFDELNRLGPNAISMLNRMGLDGMRTIKSITAMSQQTGGIGSAVRESMAAYNEGSGPNSALNRGSRAAFGGLIDQLTILKNTLAQIGEAIGSGMAPVTEGIVKGINSMTKAFGNFLDGPGGKILGWVGSAVGGFSTIAGVMMQFAAPLATAAAGMLMFRNSFTAGISRQLQLRRGLTDDQLKGAAGKYLPIANSTGGMMRNPIERRMWAAGNFVAGDYSGVGKFFFPVSNLRPGNWSRAAGMIPGLAGAGLRLLATAYDPLMHPFDPTRRMMMLRGDTWGQVLRNLASSNPQTGPTSMRGLAGQMIRTGFGALGRQNSLAEFRSSATQLAMSNRFLAAATGTPYVPLPPPTGNSLTGGTPLRAGFTANLMSMSRAGISLAGYNVMGGLGLAGLGLAQAGRGLVYSVPSMAAAAGRGLIGLARNPLMAGMLGFGLYQSLKGGADTEWNKDDVSFMDAYKLAVGDATTATIKFGDALKEAMSKFAPTSVADAMRVTPEQVKYASMADYQYENPHIKKLDLETVKSLVASELGNPEATPKSINALKMDVLAKTGGDPVLTSRILREAKENKGQFNFDALTHGWFSKFSAKAEMPWFAKTGDGKEHMQLYGDTLAALLSDRASVAFDQGGIPAYQQRRRSDVISLFSSLGKIAGQEGLAGYEKNPSTGGKQPHLLNPGLINTYEMDFVDDWVNKNLFGGTADIGNDPAAIGRTNEIDLHAALEKGGGVETWKKLASELVTAKDTEPSKRFARQFMGLNWNQLVSLSKNGYYLKGQQNVATLESPGLSAWKGAGLIPVSSQAGKKVTWEDFLAQGGSNGDALVEKLMKGQISPSEELRQRWIKNTDIGKLIEGDPFIERALAPENADNANIQIDAIDQLTRKMQDAGWGFDKIGSELGKLQAIIASDTDPLYQLAEGARSATAALADFRQAFMAPGDKALSKFAEYKGITRNPGEGDKHFKERKTAAENEMTQSIGESIQWVKSAVIQTREFQISQRQAKADFYGPNYSPGKEGDTGQLQRAEFEYNLQRSRSQADFELQRKRAEFEYNLGRERAEADYALNRSRYLHDYHLQRSRMEEDFNRSVHRAQRSFNMQMRDANADYRRQRLWAEEDYQHQVVLMTQQSARSILDIYKRVDVQRTWSAGSLLDNQADQLQRIQQQSQGLDQLRGMGVSSDVIKMLNLTDANNAQQLQRLLADFSDAPELVDQYNKMAKDRLKAAGDLVKDQDNAQWEEMTYQHEKSMSRAAESFATQIARSRRNFRIQMRQQREDMKIQAERMADDHKTQMDRMAENQKTTMARMAADHKRQMTQSLADFNRMMDRMATDHARQVRQMIDDFEKQIDRARRQFRRTARDMTMSIDDIFKAAGKTLHGSLLDQANKVEKAWDKLENMVLRKSARLKNAVEKQWGVQIRGGNNSTSSDNSGSDAAHQDKLRGDNYNWGGNKSNLPSGDMGNTSSASGGVLPGWSPGVDIHTFHSPTAGTLRLSGGEAIMRPEWTKAVGGPGAVARMNREAVTGKKLSFAKGGVVPPLAGATWSQHKTGYPWARWAGDLNVPGGDAGMPVRAYMDGVVSLVKHLTYSYGQYVKINHPSNKTQTLYAHMQPGSIVVHPGQRVSAGQKIGQVGHTGNAQGDHLHFEIKGGMGPIVLGGGKAGGGSIYDVRRPSYGFEKLIGKNKFLSTFFGGDLISRGLNKIIGRGYRKMHINPAMAPGDPAGLAAHFAGGGGTVGKNVGLGKKMAAAYGWGNGDQWNALYQLWQRESGWSHTADNPSSSAYGIPQGLVDLHHIPKPYWATKTGSGASSHYYGGDPATQIAWGLKYIKGAYGNPGNAWRHWQGVKSYGDGALFKAGMKTINVGERGPEAVLPLNKRGADFLSTVMKRYGHEAKMSTHGCSVPMQNITYNYRVDKSANFHGAITVQANDPRELAEKLRMQQRKKALTSPILQRPS